MGKSTHNTVDPREGESGQLYTTWGTVRGGCQHNHRSLRTAAACLKSDRDGCHRQGGYSDRSIRGVIDAECIWHHDVNRGPGAPIDAEVMAEVMDHWNRAEWV